MVSARSVLLALSAAVAAVQAQAPVEAPAITAAPCSPCQAAITAVPECASGCILSAAVTRAHCGSSDYQCQCAQSAAIRDAAFNCVVGNCGVVGGLGTAGSVASVCQCVAANGCGAAKATAAV